MRKGSFHNTIAVAGQCFIDFEQAAQTQEQLVLAVFEQERKPMAWFEVKSKLNREMNEVSLKRSISNLSTDKVCPLSNEIIEPKKLIKTSEMVCGTYGKPCHRYELINP